MSKIGRPRRFETPDAMEETWAAYKNRCNNMNVLSHEFSGNKKGTVVLKKSYAGSATPKNTQLQG